MISPLTGRLFLLAKANHLNHMRTAEYVTLVAAADDVSGHHGVGVLLSKRSIEKRCEGEPSWSCSQKRQDHERASEANHKPAFQSIGIRSDLA
jgi:hypothetical protein